MTKAGITETMRSKEQAHDYRYFPEPDLMPLAPEASWIEEVKKRVVELPLAKKQRLMLHYQIPASDADTFVQDVPLGNYFEKNCGSIQESENCGQLDYQQHAGAHVGKQGGTGRP